MAKHDVLISVVVEDGTSCLDYRKPTGGPAHKLKVKRTETISWTCDYPFGISFQGATPVNGWSFTSALVEGKHTVSANVLAGAAPNNYKYTVAVTVSGSGSPVIDDPELIVEPESQ